MATRHYKIWLLLFLLLLYLLFSWIFEKLEIFSLLPVQMSVTKLHCWFFAWNRYLQIEWNVKKAPTEGARSFDKPTMKGATPGCPQQSNSSDCGVYVLQYIESFFQV